MRVAYIGVGTMGGPVAGHVLAAGHDLAVYDPRPEATAPLGELGARIARSPGDAARGAEIVGIVVLDAAQVRAVLFGEDGVTTTADAGTVVAIHSTIEAATMVELADELVAQGLVPLDAPLSGGEAGAKRGDLCVMAGGDAEALDRARPVLASFAGAVVHVGPVGTGTVVKLARNLVSYVSWLAEREAFLMVRAAGVDRAALVEVLDATDPLLVSAVRLGLGLEPLPPDASPETMRWAENYATIAEKDLDAALALAAALGLELPVTDAAVDQARALYGLAPRVRP